MEFLSLDLPALLSACFASISCAVLGNYLVLRRLSLMGDAISHSVLPGIVAAFLLTSSRGTVVVFIGAALAGISSAVLIELVRKFGKVEAGASMGVVFSIYFALGVLLIEQAAARSIDLDADCLLHGQLETIFWYPPSTFSSFFSLDTLYLLPSEVYASFLTMLLALAFVWILYKELMISSFDPELATSLGFNSSLLYQLLMILVAASVVASFKIVGSILVIAMIICPAAIARLHTDRLKVQIALSALFAIISSILGYVLGAFGPQMIGYPHSVSVSGMIAVVCGLMLAFSAVFAPEYGILPRAKRRSRLALRVREDDLLAMLYRAVEKSAQVSREDVYKAFHDVSLTKRVIVQLIRNKFVEERTVLTLLNSGDARGRRIVREHRLWESYLVQDADFPPDHVHHTAEALEHFSPSELESALAKAGQIPDTDPHGKKIP